MQSRRFESLKSTVPLDEIIPRLVEVMRTLTPEELNKLLSRLDDAVSAPLETNGEHAALATLSPRQRQIFDFVSLGVSNGDVARTLGLSIKTVQTQRAKVNRKLGVRSPAALVRYAALAGLLR